MQPSDQSVWLLHILTNCVCLQSANMEDPAKGTSDRDGKTLSARQAADRQPRRRSSPSPGAEQPPGRCAEHTTPTI